MTKEEGKEYLQYLYEKSLITMKEAVKRNNLAKTEAFVSYGSSKACYKAFLDGVEWADDNPYWRDVRDVDEFLPPVDEKVIVLVGDSLMISFAHIVNKKYAVDYNGWNIPDVRYWMPFPQIEEE